MKKIIEIFIMLVLGFTCVFADDVTMASDLIVSLNEVQFSGSTNLSWTTSTKPFILNGIFVRLNAASTNSVSVYKRHKGSSNYLLVSFDNGTNSWQNGSWLGEGSGVYIIPRSGDSILITGPTNRTISVLLQTRR